MSSSQRATEVARKSLSDALRLSFNILKLIMAGLLILFLTSGIFVVEQHEAGIILRFGKIAGIGLGRVLGPGLHWAWPFPVDEHITIPVARIHSVEISFMPKSLEVTGEGRRKVPEKLCAGIDRYCLTGDGNIIHSKWMIRYRVSDPIAYITGAEEPERVLKVISKNAVLRETSEFGVDEALRTNVDELRIKVLDAIAGELEERHIGIIIESVDLRDMMPPLQVKDAFTSVIRAEQEKSWRINEARAYTNRVVNEVYGESARILSHARTYKTRVVERAKADEQYLKGLLAQYPDSPEGLNIFLNQLYHEVIEETLAGVEERFIIRRGEEKDEIRYIIGPGK